jgi:hypothetical protein
MLQNSETKLQVEEMKMSSRPLSIAALGAIAALSMSVPASAGSPCCCTMACAVPAPVVKVYRPYEVPRIYIVNQGPVYSGPGIYTRPLVVGAPRMAGYPYVGPRYRYHGRSYYRPMPRRVYRGPIRVRY